MKDFHITVDDNPIQENNSHKCLPRTRRFFYMSALMNRSRQISRDSWYVLPPSVSFLGNFDPAIAHADTIPTELSNLSGTFGPVSLLQQTQ